MNFRSIARNLAQLLVLVLVGWGVLAAVQSASIQLSHQQAELLGRATEYERLASSAPSFSESKALHLQAAQARQAAEDYWKADWRFLVLAGVFYGLGSLPAAKYWHDCLSALGQHVPLPTAFWAYFYGNLGKYVPGKAMVIVMRLASLSHLGVRRVATTLAIFIETLTLMAVGSAVSAVCLLMLNLDWRISSLAGLAVVATFLPTYPPLLRTLLVRLQPGVEPKELQVWAGRLSWGLVFRGWLSLGLTWIGFGLSLGFVIYGLPATEFTTATPIQFWLSAMGASALAVVIGFVSMIPGGAGVREVVLSMVLAPVVGPMAALSSAIWLRVTWLVVELMMAAGFYFFRFTDSTSRHDH